MFIPRIEREPRGHSTPLSVHYVECHDYIKSQLTLYKDVFAAEFWDGRTGYSESYLYETLLGFSDEDELTPIEEEQIKYNWEISQILKVTNPEGEFSFSYDLQPIPNHENSPYLDSTFIAYEIQNGLLTVEYGITVPEYITKYCFVPRTVYSFRGAQNPQWEKITYYKTEDGYKERKRTPVPQSKYAELENRFIAGALPGELPGFKVDHEGLMFDHDHFDYLSPLPPYELEFDYNKN